MENTATSKVNNALNLNYSGEDNIWLSQQKTLRKLVGILGMLLPVLIYLFLLIDNGHSSPLDSISHYYFTRSCGIFEIIVSLLAIFLLVYKGKEPIDFYISSIAGIFALCVLLFPTSNITTCCDIEKKYSVTVLKICNFREIFHFASAGIFLACLAFMSLFLFTKSDKPVSKRSSGKKLRNKIFRICGVLMVLAVLVILVGSNGWIGNVVFYNDHHLTFWMETLAVESFGISWLVKGEAIIKD